MTCGYRTSIIKSNQIYLITQKQNKETDENEKKTATCMKKTVWQQCVGRDIKAGTCSNRCPPDCTTDLQWEHLIQSNKKFKDFNFSLKLVMVLESEGKTKVMGLMGHKMQKKHIEGDRVVGVNLHLYWVPSLYLHFMRWKCVALRIAGLKSA